jgi:hypothetical protein
VLLSFDSTRESGVAERLRMWDTQFVGLGGEPREDLGRSSDSGAARPPNLGGEVEWAVDGRFASVGVAGRRGSGLNLENWAVDGAVEGPRRAGWELFSIGVSFGAVRTAFGSVFKCGLRARG